MNDLILEDRNGLRLHETQVYTVPQVNDYVQIGGERRRVLGRIFNGDSPNMRTVKIMLSNPNE